MILKAFSICSYYILGKKIYVLYAYVLKYWTYHMIRLLKCYLYIDEKNFNDIMSIYCVTYIVFENYIVIRKNYK